MVLDPNVQRAIEGSRAFRKKQRDRLGEITDGGIALLEQPIRNPARLRGPRRETPHRDQPLRSFAAQEVDRPGRVSRRGMREIVNHGVHFLTRASRLVDRGYEGGELSHATISSPATLRSCSSDSPSPSQRLATASARTPCSMSHLTTGSRKPCVTQTHSAAVASMAASSDGQSAWSDKAKPRSRDRRRRAPRMRIQPEAKPVEIAPKRRSQSEPDADGGASTSPPA